MSVAKPLEQLPNTPDIVHPVPAQASVASGISLAVLRVATGFIFLWAFLDKTFGLHYSTSTAKSWLNGGSPTNGFLKSVNVGPLESLFHDIAGSWWTNILFMAGLLFIGVAVILGIGLRISAVSGALMMAMMWIAEYPLAQFTSIGEPTGSTNPIVDYHLMYALVLIVLATTHAGSVWGFGRAWERLPFVSHHHWAR